MSRPKPQSALMTHVPQKRQRRLLHIRPRRYTHSSSHTAGLPLRPTTHTHKSSRHPRLTDSSSSSNSSLGVLAGIKVNSCGVRSSSSSSSSGEAAARQKQQPRLVLFPPVTIQSPLRLRLPRPRCSSSREQAKEVGLRLWEELRKHTCTPPPFQRLASGSSCPLSLVLRVWAGEGGGAGQVVVLRRCPAKCPLLLSMQEETEGEGGGLGVGEGEGGSLPVQRRPPL